jgi:indolepyruvate ferredoxin oxidoreductase beta subunit
VEVDMTKNILIVGVGGQGTILASKLLTNGLLKAGYDVKMSEIHGMSQRGGSVHSHVRYGDKVYSPIINRCEADILVSFEKMEALRWLPYLKKGGKVVVNNYEIPPMSVITGQAVYSTKILEKITQLVDTIVIDAAKNAKELGNLRVMNVILLGTIIKLMGLEHIDWNDIIRENVKPNFVDINILALERGKSLV